MENYARDTTGNPFKISELFAVLNFWENFDFQIPLNPMIFLFFHMPMSKKKAAFLSSKDTRDTTSNP